MCDILLARGYLAEGESAIAFPTDLTSVLSGASVAQLRSWRSTELLRPEVQQHPRVLYSFRDVLALRTFVRLRRHVSLQKIRRAMASLRDYDLTDHPASYKLVADHGSILLLQDDSITDLVTRKGQELLGTMEDVLAPFENMQGDIVVDFRRPRPNLEVRERRMGGWPTISGTRIPYNNIALLLQDGSVAPDEVHEFYPSVSAAAAIDAVNFDGTVRRLQGD
ncbi:uncharacterized protein (DUF433 family)/DNA-binding transcriptional MerR regulator [Sinomonas atrocyanea]|uniref:DUF433 domain-containing protein n=1 Tax=Sinomonas atrocyanea TaxID=37927 RepID=UPI002783A2BB|nr:DUF433 domain-containing protein [Sinomonas atrocyanea]MDQ0261034.1 uncharacterized protein (DUF433 family)/DNA-binding transcriptional MerR regulator [Sinomonas atrocyanea]